MSTEAMQVKDASGRYLAKAAAQEVPPGYKRTEVGVIPEDWEAKCLGDVAIFRTGPFGSALHKSDYIDGGIPLINPMHIVDGQLVPEAETSVSEQAARRLKVFRLRPNDIVIGRRGNMGRCAVVQQSQAGWLCGTGSLIIRCSDGVDVVFLQRVLSTERAISAIESSSVGTTMINLNQAALAGLQIQFPPPPEQRVIAEALSDVEGLLGALEALIAKKRAIKQGAMQQLLTGKTRLPGFSGAWEATSLGRMGATYGGLSGKSKPDFGVGAARYVTFLNVLENVVLDPDQFENVRVAPGESQNRVLEGDLLFNGTSETPGDLAMGAVLRGQQDDLYLNSFCFGFRIHDPRQYQPLFLAYYFRGPTGRAIMYALAQGATRYNMSKGQFLALALSMPSSEEQTAIATVLSDMDAEIAALERRRDKTRALKQGMMQQLLTGRVRLMEPEGTADA